MSGNNHRRAILCNPHGKLVDSLRLYLKKTASEAREGLSCVSECRDPTCSAVDPPPTSPALNNGLSLIMFPHHSLWLALSHVRLQTWRHNPRTPQLTGDTFQESVNDDELKKNIFIKCFGVFSVFNQGNWRKRLMMHQKKKKSHSDFDFDWLCCNEKHFLFLQGRLVPPGQQSCAPYCCRSVLPRCVCLLGR